MQMIPLLDILIRVHFILMTLVIINNYIVITFLLWFYPELCHFHKLVNQLL